MRRQAHILLTVSAILLATALPTTAYAGEPAAQAAGDAYAATDQYIRDRMDVTATPGLAYAVVGPHGIEHVNAFGHDGDGDPVTAETPFLWGSVAKPVTATAVMGLVESGDLELDEPVRTYLPDFALDDETSTETITVRHLLQQTSGIPEGTDATDRFDSADDPYGDAVATLADVEPFAEPGARHEYASANYLVLGAVVEAVTGETFAGHLRETVLDPLQMDSAITSEAGVAAAGLPPGHRYVAGRPVRYDGRYDPAGPSYGYLGGTVEDLAHFAEMNLNHGDFAASTILSADSVDAMHTDAVENADLHTYALGWRNDTRNADLRTRTVWCAGSVSGFHAMVTLLPDIDRAVVVVQNAAGPFQDYALTGTGLGAARMLAGGEPASMPVDPAYAVILGGLSAAVLVLVVAIVGSWRRARQPHRGRARSVRRRVLSAGAWLVACAATAYGAAVVIPRANDAALSDVLLWAPDVGWLLVAVTVCAVVLAALRLALPFRTVPSTTAAEPARGAAAGVTPPRTTR